MAIYGLSGAGKSTTCRAIVDALSARGQTVEVVKIAAPLYELQAHIYGLVGRQVERGQQDQELLRALAGQVRRISPTFLVEDFLARVGRSDADVVVNDDLKDTAVDYPRLVEAGFRFLHVTCTEEVRVRRLGTRADLTQVAETTTTWGFGRITPHWTLDNSFDGAGRLRSEVEALISGWCG